MRDEAVKAEKQTTGDLSGISKDLGGEMVGLSQNLKSQESLERKITEKQTEAAAAGLSLSPTEAGGRIHDALRYTMTFDSDHYTDSVKAAAGSMKVKGYSFDTGRVKNTWDSPVYRGLNTTALTPDGTAFELQFHTPESFDMKENVQHPLYEEARLSSTSDSRRQELNDQMASQAASLTPPRGASSLTPDLFG